MKGCPICEFCSNDVLNFGGNCLHQLWRLQWQFPNLWHLSLHLWWQWSYSQTPALFSHRVQELPWAHHRCTDIRFGKLLLFSFVLYVLIATTKMWENFFYSTHDNSVSISEHRVKGSFMSNQHTNKLPAKQDIEIVIFFRLKSLKSSFSEIILMGSKVLGKGLG